VAGTSVEDSGSRAVAGFTDRELQLMKQALGIATLAI
jgi:hypothetical protein